MSETMAPPVRKFTKQLVDAKDEMREEVGLIKSYYPPAGREGV